MSDAYEIVWWRGHEFDKMTVEALEAAEAKLGYTFDVYQGSYSGSVDASAGTHAGGGAVDLTAYDYQRKVKVLRDTGFAAWHRPSTSDWVAHIHAILLGNDKASDGAKNQMRYYRDGLNGLADHARDPNPYRPDPIRDYQYKGEASKWSGGAVYVSRLHRGQTDSDSVRRLQYRLLHHPDIPARYVRLSGNYHDGTATAVSHWQRKVAGDLPGPKDGSELSMAQARRLFGQRYEVTVSH